MNENTEVISVKVNSREINKQTNMHFLNSVWFPIALVWRVHEEMVCRTAELCRGYLFTSLTAVCTLQEEGLSVETTRQR